MDHATAARSFPCGNSTMTEPLVFPIGATTELWQCGGCSRHLRRTMHSYFSPDLCLSCAMGQRKW